MACFSVDATWTTGTESLRGAGQLEELFAGAFRELCPQLHVQSILAQGDRVACELREDFVADGSERSEPIAGFYRVAHGRITAGKIYREGSAEV